MKTVVVNGTFDVLHIGHLALLNHARNQGDYLIVAIDSDLRVRRLKGYNRPINNQDERKSLLENLRCVDQVKIFDSDQELIDIVEHADVVVKGGDYRERDFFERRYCKQLIFFDRIDGYSSTEKIQDIINRR